jgi:streptogramin lyase
MTRILPPLKLTLTSNAFTLILKFLLFVPLFCFYDHLNAGIKPGYKHKSEIKRSKQADLLAVPSLSYSGPNIYTAGKAITTLLPTGSGVAAPGYAVNAVTVGSGFNRPRGVAVDAAGNVFIADNGNHVVKKIPAGGGSAVIFASGFGSVNAIAVDANGNVYVADSLKNAVKKIAAAGGTPITVAANIINGPPINLAVDAAGDVFIANGFLIEIPVSGANPFTYAFFDGKFIQSVAIDHSGNIYVGLSGQSHLEKIE